jgi:hypothetical protein
MVHAEAPGSDKGPGEILARIPDVGEFPIQNAHQAAIVYDEIADAKVAMTHHPRSIQGPVLTQVKQADLDRGVWLTQAVQLRPEAL